MTTKERLIKFLDHLNISQGKFEKNVGLSNGYVNNVGESIRRLQLNKISNVYPELNTAWLLTGVGEMLTIQTIEPVVNKSNSSLEQIIEQQKLRMAWLEEQLIIERQRYTEVTEEKAVLKYRLKEYKDTDLPRATNENLHLRNNDKH